MAYEATGVAGDKLSYVCTSNQRLVHSRPKLKVGLGLELDGSR